MRFLEMGLAFAVIGFVAANAVLSAVTALVWRGLKRRQLDADTLFLIRMFPALGSAAFVFGIILPAYLLFEPRGTSEQAGPVLGMVAVVAFVLVLAGIWRALTGWLEARRLDRLWSVGADRATTMPFPVAVYRVPTRMPLAALVGVVRPRLFVSGEFLDALGANERQAVLDHEVAHLHAFDNLKRTAVKVAPDWLSFLSVGREIEAAWTIATEEEADDRASGPEGAKALDLAAALIKASRLAPIRYAVTSSFCEESTIVRRVARLLHDRPARRGGVSHRVARLLVGLAIVTAVGLLAGPGLRPVYTLSEATIHILNHGAW